VVIRRADGGWCERDAACPPMPREMKQIIEEMK
jgi:hypothetical protein